MCKIHSYRPRHTQTKDIHLQSTTPSYLPTVPSHLMSSIWKDTRMPKSGYIVVDLQLDDFERKMEEAVNELHLMSRKDFTPIFQSILPSGETLTDEKRQQCIVVNSNISQPSKDNLRDCLTPPINGCFWQ